MKEIRIQPVPDSEGHANYFLVGIVCDCGVNCLIDEAREGERRFNHPVDIGSQNDRTLFCPGCGKKYLVKPGRTHFHVREL